MGLSEFNISEHGLTIGEKLEEITGILGWSTLRAPN
jgi:hypothetical protein